MKVGITLPMADGLGQPAPRWPEIRELALWAEDAGFDSVWLFDHLLMRRDESSTAGIWSWAACTRSRSSARALPLSSSASRGRNVSLPTWARRSNSSSIFSMASTIAARSCRCSVASGSGPVEASFSQAARTGQVAPRPSTR